MINDRDCHHRDCGDREGDLSLVSITCWLLSECQGCLSLSANLNFIEAELLRSGTELADTRWGWCAPVADSDLVSRAREGNLLQELLCTICRQ